MKLMTNIESNLSNDDAEFFRDIKGELDILSFGIKKESFKAKQELKNRVKALGFYDGDGNGENIKFYIGNVKKYLESIKNKTRSDLDVKSSELEKGVRTIAIQIAINYINMKNGRSITNNIDLIDGIRGNQTWKGVKEFQSTYKLKNVDGLPGRETITKILEILGNYIGSDNENDGVEADASETENFDETEEFLQNGLNQNSVDNSKCINLIKNLKINDNSKLHDMQDLDWIDFENKLKDKFVDESSLELIIFQNPKIQKLLCSIISNQGKEIDSMKKRYLNRKNAEHNNNAQKEAADNELNKDKKQTGQSWEDYKFENSSIDNFENFILSEKGISVIINEIKSHIDTSHENGNGEYDRFYDKYPLSAANLEIKLKDAWESSMKSDYNKENYDEKMEKLDVISNQITLYVDEIIGKSLKGGKEDFSQHIIPELEGLFLKGTERGNIIELLSNQDYRDSFMEVLGSKIKSYETFVRNKDNDFILNTGDKQIDLQLKSYLYIYGRIFYGRIFYSDYFNPGKNTEYYDEILPDVMKSIISHDDKSLINKINNKKFLEMQQKLEEEKKKRDIARRQKLAEINRKRNDSLQSTPKTKNLDNIDKIQIKSLNPNDATGPEIAAEANLDLSDYSLNIEESEYKGEWEKETVFRNAYNKFIHSHGDIKAYITQEQMLRIFDVDTNSIKEEKWKKFVEFNPLFKDKSSNEIEDIRHIFDEFSWYYSDVKEELSKDSSVMREKVSDTVKTYAIGAVIDNVRDTFNTITDEQTGNFRGFQLNNDDPIEKYGNNVIISGIFNGSEIKIYYNLQTGKLSMNSFFKKVENEEKYIIGNDILVEIGQIKNFNNVLNGYYKLEPRAEKNTDIHNGFPSGEKPSGKPTNFDRDNRDGIDGKHSLSGSELPHPKQSPRFIGSPMTSTDQGNLNSERRDIKRILGSQIDLMSEVIKNNTESQAQKNSTITKFMKTFNIMSDFREYTSLIFDNESNLFDIIRIIDNTGDIKNSNIQSLEYFNNKFMPIIMEYSGLEWGHNNLLGSQRNEKNEDKYDITFNNQNKENKNENLSLIKENAKSFSINPGKRGETENYNGNYKLGFIELIKEKITKGSGQNLEFDISQMKKFIESLEFVDKDNKEGKSDENYEADKRLLGELPNV